ncbi:MAG: hypothetical protein H0Z28_12455, partial [Archaeoglobus sp.]|nr:hypothetical protein [Archaeoglobus sp.]
MTSIKGTFRVKRFDGKRKWYQEYEIDFRQGMTVLDGLCYIKDFIDPSLSFRASCRMGICGSCAMK